MKLLASFYPVFALALILGCGSGGNQPTTGTVTLDGEPLAGAEIIFAPEEGGRPAVAETDKRGNFELIYTVGEMGAPPGKYIVRIQTSTTITDANGEEMAVEEKLPAKYNRNSTLTVEVKAGEKNHFDLALDSQE